MAFRLANKNLSFIINHLFDLMAYKTMMSVGYYETLLYLSTVDMARNSQIIKHTKLCPATQSKVLQNLHKYRFIDKVIEDEPGKQTKWYYKICETGLELLKLLKDTEKYEKT
jgi:DNA-binding HxlR family transcriptional regulator